ncbi:AraC family transcriptional regulator [Paenibacillus psychroresistens]|uniref:AraC family transcriptional regulator n=1 Tax=Paenibacillus psychroresistens TaxID=1778678 RepID=A0A6B8RLL6_9BACL|nr:AraC family transcriptional regulator [Paenibacillus psychroresistens]QGQ97291.1 AraC family transcriptional regulator [Paenibacillus psychroresistens]
MKPIDLAQGPWSVQLHTVKQSYYSKLDLQNCLFSHWIISYVKEGYVRTTTRGESHYAKAGDIMLHPPHLPFAEYSETKGDHLWIQVSLLCSHHFDLLQLYRVSPIVTISDFKGYEAVFLKLMTAWEDQGAAFRDLKLTSAMLQLTEQIMVGWENAGSPKRSEAFNSSGDRFSDLVGQMSLRLHQKVSREDLAAQVCLSSNYMDRVFQQQYGLTPMQMLREMRLNRAKQLLEQTTDTLESIASQCGLTDASYLCKQFKKQFSKLPTEYRESVRITQSADLYGV